MGAGARNKSIRTVTDIQMPVFVALPGINAGTVDDVGKGFGHWFFIFFVRSDQLHGYWRAPG